MSNGARSVSISRKIATMNHRPWINYVDKWCPSPVLEVRDSGLFSSIRSSPKQAYLSPIVSEFYLNFSPARQWSGSVQSSTRCNVTRTPVGHLLSNIYNRFEHSGGLPMSIERMTFNHCNRHSPSMSAQPFFLFIHRMKNHRQPSVEMLHRAIRHRSSPRARFYPQRRRKQWSTNSWRTQSNPLVGKTRWSRGSNQPIHRWTSRQRCNLPSTDFDHPDRPKHREINRKPRLNFSNKRRGQKRSPAFNSILVLNSSIVDEPQPPIDSPTAEYLRHPRVIITITNSLSVLIILIGTALTRRPTTTNARCDDQSEVFDSARSGVDSLIVDGHNGNLFYHKNGHRIRKPSDWFISASNEPLLALRLALLRSSFLRDRTPVYSTKQRSVWSSTRNYRFCLINSHRIRETSDWFISTSNEPFLASSPHCIQSHSGISIVRSSSNEHLELSPIDSIIRIVHNTSSVFSIASDDFDRPSRVPAWQCRSG